MIFFSPISKAKSDIPSSRAMRKDWCSLAYLTVTTLCNPSFENALKDQILTKFSALQSDELTARILSFVKSRFSLGRNARRVCFHHPLNFSAITPAQPPVLNKSRPFPPFFPFSIFTTPLFPPNQIHHRRLTILHQNHHQQKFILTTTATLSS